MKNLILALMVTLLTACGGAEFNADTDVSLAGEGGEPAAPAGSSSGGGGSGGGKGGAAPVAGSAPTSCEFDPALMMAALPKELDLGDFTFTSGDLCVTCRDTPCRKVAVISWGVPAYDETAGWIIRPNVDTTMVSLNIGANDGSCTMEKSCGTKPDQPAVVLTVKRDGSGWIVDTAQFSMTFYGNACTNEFSSGNYLGELTKAVNATVSATLKSLKFPCAH